MTFYMLKYVISTHIDSVIITEKNMLFKVHLICHKKYITITWQFFAGDLALAELYTERARSGWSVCWVTWLWLNCFLGDLALAELFTWWLGSGWTVYRVTFLWLNCILNDLALALHSFTYALFHSRLCNVPWRSATKCFAATEMLNLNYEQAVHCDVIVVKLFSYSDSSIRAFSWMHN